MKVPKIDNGEKWSGSPSELLEIFNLKASELNLDEDGNIIEKTEEPTEKEISDLEANYKEHYKYEGVGKCPKRGNERGLFENTRNKDENLCAVCLQRAIKEECDRSVESVSIDGVPEANIEAKGGVLG